MSGVVLEKPGRRNMISQQLQGFYYAVSSYAAAVQRLGQAQWN
jgi:hypothetical protein